MAKLIAFLVFLCIEFSRQEEVVSTLKDKTAFPEQQIIHETYPLDIKLDENDEKLIDKAQDPDEQIWEDYIDVTLDIEDWMMKVNPSWSKYKWLKVLEEGSVAKKILPKCSDKAVSFFDYYHETPKNSWLNSGNDDAKLLEVYNKLTEAIEKRMKDSEPSMSNYKWLKVVEKGTHVNCLDSDGYDDYDIDVRTYVGDKGSNQIQSPKVRKPKSTFKRFTSV